MMNNQEEDKNVDEEEKKGWNSSIGNESLV